MTKKTFFSRISKSLQAPKEKTSEELDKELEDSVNSIWNEEVDLLSASSVMSGGKAETGDMVLVMSLTPIYDIIGGRQGRLADSLREACERVFSQNISEDRGRGTLSGDQFIMRFFRLKKTSFDTAVAIINEIGTFILSDRFKTMDLKRLLTIAEVGDLADDKGMLDHDKLAVTLNNGGRRVDIQNPRGDEPEWYKMFCENNSNLKIAFNESQNREAGDAQWKAGSYDDEDVDQEWSAINRKPGAGEKKERGPDRRQTKMKVNPRKERRTSWNSRRVQDKTSMT